jgi:hypothetical protein
MEILSVNFIPQHVIELIAIRGIDVIMIGTTCAFHLVTGSNRRVNKVCMLAVSNHFFLHRM